MQHSTNTDWGKSLSTGGLWGWSWWMHPHSSHFLLIRSSLGWWGTREGLVSRLPVPLAGKEDDARVEAEGKCAVFRCAVLREKWETNPPVNSKRGESSCVWEDTSGKTTSEEDWWGNKAFKFIDVDLVLNKGRYASKAGGPISTRTFLRSPQ